MSYRVNTLVPFKFYTGDRLNPEHLNANAVSLDQAARWLLQHRYTYFVLRIPFGRVPVSVSASYEAFTVVPDYDYDLLYAGLHVVGHDADTTMTGNTLTAGFKTITVPVGQNHAVLNQGVRWLANDSVTFSLVHANTQEINAYAELYLRHDRLGHINVQAMPRVKASDTRSATEWNTWYQGLEAQLAGASILTKWPYARKMEILSVGDPAAGLSSITSGAKYSRQYMPTRKGYLEKVDCYVAETVGGAGTLTQALYSVTDAFNVFSVGISTAAPGLSSSVNNTPANPAIASGGSALYYNIDGGGGAACRAYSVLQWRE